MSQSGQGTDQQKLIASAQSGDRVAQGHLIATHLGLVTSIARRFAGRGLDMDDLVQLGLMGLMKAIDRFDPSQNTALATYATPLVLGHIRDGLRSEGQMSVGRSVKEQAAAVSKAGAAIAAEIGREASMDELCQRTGLSKEAVVMALDAARPLVSLDAQITPDKPALVEQVACKETNLEEAVALQDAVERLPALMREVITLRFSEDLTQKEAGLRLGIGQVRVSRLESMAISALRASF